MKKIVYKKPDGDMQTRVRVKFQSGKHQKTILDNKRKKHSKFCYGYHRYQRGNVTIYLTQKKSFLNNTNWKISSRRMHS